MRYPQVAERLLTSGAQADLQDSHGYTALMLAAERGSAELVQLLLDVPADNAVNCQNWRGETALMCAATRGHVEVSRLILILAKNGSMHHRSTHGDTALLRAAKLGHVEVVRLLMAEGAGLQNSTLGQKVLPSLERALRPAKMFCSCSSCPPCCAFWNSWVERPDEMAPRCSNGGYIGGVFGAKLRDSLRKPYITPRPDAAKLEQGRALAVPCWRQTPCTVYRIPMLGAS